MSFSSFSCCHKNKNIREILVFRGAKNSKLQETMFPSSAETNFFPPRHYNKCNATLFRLWVSRGPTGMNSYQISTAVVLLLSTAASAQRTPTISYITPDITSKIGGTIEMDCSVLYAAEYPVLWVKLPPQVQHLLWYLRTPIFNFPCHVSMKISQGASPVQMRTWQEEVD